jgi:hypothetical protein
LIIARVAVEAVIAGDSEQLVSRDAAAHGVMAAPAIKHIFGIPAEKMIVSIAADQSILASVAEDPIVTTVA